MVTGGILDEAGKPYCFLNGTIIPSKLLPKLQFTTPETFADALRTWRDVVKDVVEAIHEYEYAISVESQDETDDGTGLNDEDGNPYCFLTGEKIPANRFPPGPKEVVDSTQNDLFDRYYKAWIKACKNIVKRIHDEEKMKMAEE